MRLLESNVNRVNEAVSRKYIPAGVADSWETRSPVVRLGPYRYSNVAHFGSSQPESNSFPKALKFLSPPARPTKES